MHTFSVIASVLAVSGTAIAAFSPGNVPIATRTSWCNSQVLSCNSLCSGSYQTNSCTADNLVYSCTCNDGTTPDLATYMQTIPFFVCQETKNECVAANTTDARLQAQCMRDNVCGTINPYTNVAASTTAGSSSSSSAAATHAATSAAGTTTMAAAATTTAAKSGAVQIAQAIGVPALAAAVLFGVQMLL